MGILIEYVLNARKCQYSKKAYIMFNNKILTICPSYKRPELCAKMLKSWEDGIGENNTIVLGLDVGDPFISSYPRYTNRILCKAGSTVTEVINSIYNQFPDYDYYHIINDDVLFHTKYFDTKLMNILKDYGGGIAYGNDLFQGQGLPTFPFISSEIIEAIGYLQMPKLNRYCGDTVYADIGHLCDCLYYLGEVIIEHRHKLAGKGVDDVDMDTYQKDLVEYFKWTKDGRSEDCRKVKEALNGKC